MAEPEHSVVDNRRLSRYELREAGAVLGELAYGLGPGTIVLHHTEVAPAGEGRGLGSKLVAAALDDIRTQGLRVVPHCPFVRRFLERHPEYADLLER